MMDKNQIPEPLVFNPLKHYLPFIKDFISFHIANPPDSLLIREMKHLGMSVMDVYKGALPQDVIFKEVLDFLNLKELKTGEEFGAWVGKDCNSFKVTALSDGSLWTLKFNDHKERFVHLFPARSSPHTFRVKSNTLKSAILYLILIGKDYVTGDGLNRARALMGLPPVKEVAETEAVTQMIEVLRS